MNILSNPSPDNYNPNESFNSLNKKPLGKFEKSKKMNYKDPTLDNPGPTAYRSFDYLSSKNNGFTMPNSKRKFPVCEYNSNPAPNFYNVKSGFKAKIPIK